MPVLFLLHVMLVIYAHPFHTHVSFGHIFFVARFGSGASCSIRRPNACFSCPLDKRRADARGELSGRRWISNAWRATSASVLNDKNGKNGTARLIHHLSFVIGGHGEG